MPASCFGCPCQTSVFLEGPLPHIRTRDGMRRATGVLLLLLLLLLLLPLLRHLGSVSLLCVR